MKYLIVCLVALAAFQTPSDAFLSSLISGLTNVVGSVVDTVNNGVNTVTSTINTVTQVGQFLWDNAVSPSLTVLQQNGADFIDNYFGNILNAIGKRQLVIDTRQEKLIIKGLYMAKTNELIQKLNELFHRLIESIKFTIMGNIDMLLNGQLTVQQLFADLFSQIKLSVQNLIAQTLVDMNLPLTMRMNTETNVAPVVDHLRGIIQTIGQLAIDAINVVESTIVYWGSVVIGWFGK